MGTNCKLIFGYKGLDDWWNETDCYYRHYDGYDDAIIPLLKKHRANVKKMNENILKSIRHILYYASGLQKEEKALFLYDGRTEKVAELYREFNLGNYERAKEIQEEFMSQLREADSETFPRGYKHLLERASGIPFGDKEI